MDQYRMKRKKLQTYVTYICILLISINLLFSLTGIDIIDSEQVRIFVVVVLIINLIASRKLSVHTHDCVITFLLLTYYIIFKQSVALNSLVLYIISYYLKYDDIEKIKDRFFKILVFINMCWIIMLLLHITPDSINYDNGRIRHYLGFKNINQSSLFYLPLFLLYIDRYKTKLSIIITFIVATIIFLLTDTRAAYYVVILYILLLLGIKEKDRVKIIVNKILLCLIPTLTCIFLLAGKVIFYFPIIDELLTHRLSIIAQGVESLKVTNYLFGCKELLLDNSYVMFFSTFGILSFVWILKRVWIGLHITNGYEWTFLVAVLVYGFFEATLFIPESTLAMLFFLILQKTERYKVNI